jgi:hypothetical protein
MSKLVQAASILALAAATSSAGAWYAAPVAPIMTPEMAEQQMQAISAQHEAMAEQHVKAIEQAMNAHQKMIDQQTAQFAQWPAAPVAGPLAGHPFGTEPVFPELPPIPELGQYPAMPERPSMPEFGEIPAMPEMPAMPEFGQYPEIPDFARIERGAFPAAPDFLKTRLEERDAHRAKIQQATEERRAAFKAMSEQRRTQHPRPMDRAAMVSYAPGMHPAMMSSKDCSPSVKETEQQASAPAPEAAAQ